MTDVQIVFDSTELKNLEILREHIGNYPDFPAPGVLFRDIFSVYRNKEATKAFYSLLKSYALQLKNKVDVVFAIESRGFLIGPYISQILEIPFVPIRKKGKLPGKVESLEYGLEYGTDCIEIQADGAKVGTKALIVDDLIATGGSLQASCNLLKRLNIQVIQCFVIMKLVDLQGEKKVPGRVISLLDY